MSTFTCKCGLISGGSLAQAWIESPKTGRRVIVPASMMPFLPVRLVGRIASAASTGKRVADFTVAELQAVKTAAEPVKAPAVAPLAQPAVAEPLSDAAYAECRRIAMEAESPFGSGCVRTPSHRINDEFYSQPSPFSC